MPKGACQAVQINDADMALVSLQQPLFLEGIKSTSDNFEFPAEIAADFGTPNPQVKFAG